MKLTKLADKYLSYMGQCYFKSRKKIFDWEELRTQFPDEDEEFICDAMRLLKGENLITILWADNVAYQVTLNASAITNAENYPRLKKLYEIVKELRSWI